jgi:D-aminopeptidase
MNQNALPLANVVLLAIVAQEAIAAVIVAGEVDVPAAVAGGDAAVPEVAVAMEVMAVTAGDVTKRFQA